MPDNGNMTDGSEIPSEVAATNHLDVSEQSNNNNDGNTTENLVTNVVLARPFHTFDIKDPPNFTAPHQYIGEHLEQIARELNEGDISLPVRSSIGSDCYKVWIWCNSFYSKITSGRPKHSTGGYVNQPPGTQGVEIMHSNTITIRINPRLHPNELIKTRDLEILNKDLGDRFYKGREKLVESEWSFLRVGDIRMCMVTFEGRITRKILQKK